MSFAGSSTTGTFEPDQTAVNFSTQNPMYTSVYTSLSTTDVELPSIYDQITQDRMGDRISPPTPAYSERQTTSLYPRSSIKKPPLKLGEPVSVDGSEEVSSMCSGMLLVHVFAVLFIIIALVALCLVCCLWVGLVGPERTVESPPTPTTSTGICECGGECTWTLCALL